MTPTFKDRLHEVCMDTLIPVDRITSECRRTRVSQARQMLMWRLYEDGWPYDAIGEALDRDHTTAMYGVRRHAQRLQEGKA